ncbi:MAG: hypothetical protein U1E76_01850 [Planctomycetota bacterium]
MCALAIVICGIIVREPAANGSERPANPDAITLEWATSPPALVLAREPFTLLCRATNKTAASVNLVIEVDLPGTLAWQGEAPAACQLGAGESHEWRLSLVANARGTHAIDVRCAGEHPRRALRALVDTGPALPTLPAWQDRVSAEGLSDGFLLLQNDRIRLLFAEGASPGWQAALVFVRGASGEAIRAGTIRPLLRAVVQGDAGPSEATIAPLRSRLSTETDSAAVHLSGEFERGATLWRADVTCLVQRGESEVHVIHRLRASPRGKLWAFDGLTLRVGEGCSGGRKDAALLPGLEWLEGEEQSSSSALVHGSEHLRVVPHPLKITVPSVSVQAGGTTAGVLWDPRQLWDGHHAHPALRFASPNWLEREDDHLIGLFVPSVPDFVGENEARARAPYSVEQDAPLRIDAYLYAAAGQTVLTPIAAWYRRFGLADSPAVMPTHTMSLNLSVDALLQTLWDPEARGWSPTYGEAAEPNAAVMALLKVSADGENSARRRSDIRTILDQAKQEAIETDGNRTFGKLRNAALPDWNAPFLLGHLPEALEQMKRYVDLMRRRQRDDGSFPFAGAASLGEPGSVELGTCAVQVAWLLKFARMTADREARAAMLPASRP